MDTMAKTLLEQAKIRLKHGLEYIGNPDEIEVGMTPRETVYSEGPHRLYRYPSSRDEARPLLLVYSLINRPYIFDLRPGRSLIEYLCNSGFDVYLLDWGSPPPEMGQAHLTDLVCETLRRCVRKVQRLHRQKQIDMLGYCMGATFAALYTAYRPADVSKLVLLTPILGRTEKGLLQKIAQAQDINREMLAGQLISGRLLKNFFNSVKPATALKKERDFWKNHSDEQFLNHFLPVEKWSNDTPDVSAQVFFEFLDSVLYREDLLKQRFELGSYTFDFAQVRCPVFAVAAQKDWIIPAESLQVGERIFTQAPYTPYLIQGGHIGLVVGRSAKSLWTELLAFL